MIRNNTFSITLKLSLILFIIIGLFFIHPFSNPSFAEIVKSAHTQVEFIPEVTTIDSGKSFWVALHMQMDKDWHVYWKNPGDSGLTPTIEWNLPQSFKASSIYWPYPHRIDLPPLTSYGYEEETLLLTRIDTPDFIAEGEHILFQAKVNWLACKIECVPGVANLNFSLTAQRGLSVYNARFQEKFEHWEKEFPLNNTDWHIGAIEEEDAFVIKLKTPPREARTLTRLEFFPEKDNVIYHAGAQILQKEEGSYQLRIKKSSVYQKENQQQLQGVLVSDIGWLQLSPKKALKINIKFTRMVQQRKPLISNNVNHVGIAIVFAFLGGLILNLMPCVLPVLSIKILHLLEQVREDTKKSFQHGLTFTLGILTAFWILASIMMVFNIMGHKVGWGFQFQSPLFLILLSMLFFGLALNLFGVFEIGTSLTGIEGRFKHKLSGFKGSFFNGILTTVAATPCTAPFMGSALGYALIQPPLISFVIFSALGLGLAFPFLLLSRFPSLMRFIPKAGLWIVTLKRGLGFLLIVTVVWLSWVLGVQRGIYAMIFLYIGLIILGMDAWVYGRRAMVHNRKFSYLFAFILFLVALTVAVNGAAYRSESIAAFFKEKEAAIQWQEYSPQLIKQLQEEEKIIFLDFTASWCLSCQVNEQVVFNSTKVIRKFEEFNIVPVRADWTNYDETITDALAQFGKSSIPFYVLILSDSSKPYVTFPEIITPTIVLNILEKNIVD